MKLYPIQSLIDDFESHARKTKEDVEFWLARDLQRLSGYSQWRNFIEVIDKAKAACKTSERVVADHFADVSKMVELGSGSQREISDIMLTRRVIQAMKAQRKKSPPAEFPLTVI